MLSVSNNRLEDIHAVTSLRALRVLRVDRNRIVRLPGSLSSLRDLAVLDVSHNRLEAVPPALADLAARLYRFARLGWHSTTPTPTPTPASSQMVKCGPAGMRVWSLGLVRKRIAVRATSTTPLRELTCHIGSNSITCHPAEVTFPPLPQPHKAGTRFSDRRGKQG